MTDTIKARKTQVRLLLHTTVASRDALPESVLEFAAAHQVLPHLETALRLAAAHFRPRTKPVAEVETDPETDERRIVIDVTVDGDIGDVLRRNDSYTREWIANAPADVRSRIRLLYNIA